MQTGRATNADIRFLTKDIVFWKRLALQISVASVMKLVLWASTVGDAGLCIRRIVKLV